MEIGTVQSNTQVATAAPSPVPTESPANRKEIIQAVKAVNEAELFGQNNELTFAMDRGTRRSVVRIVDRKTSEVVRQIPPESVLRLAEDLMLLRA